MVTEPHPNLPACEEEGAYSLSRPSADGGEGWGEGVNPCFAGQLLASFSRLLSPTVIYNRCLGLVA